MMQALIIMDFVLSLSAQAKARMAALQAPDQKINASVLYSDHAIDEESVSLEILVSTVHLGLQSKC